VNGGATLNEHDMEFLSCLYGGERRTEQEAALHNFLSCLYGGEQFRGVPFAVLGFLSCLYGSELQPTLCRM